MRYLQSHSLSVFKSFRFRSPEWFEVFYQLEFNGKVIASGESFGWGETKEFTVPGSEEIIRG
jgi:hypothetical protein